MEETADRLLLAENMKVLVAQSCLSLCDPVEILQARMLEWLPCPPPGDLPNLRIKPVSFMSPALVGRLPQAPPGKTKSTLHDLITK